MVVCRRSHTTHTARPRHPLSCSLATLDDCGADESIARFRTKTPQVAVVSFTKSGLKVMGYGYDRNFGGRNFDEARR